MKKSSGGKLDVMQSLLSEMKSKPAADAAGKPAEKAAEPGHCVSCGYECPHCAAEKSADKTAE